MSDDEILKQAQDFYEEVLKPMLSRALVICETCAAENCINNEFCINCNVQL
jgi:hypothetical protein